MLLSIVPLVSTARAASPDPASYLREVLLGALRGVLFVDPT